MRTQSMDYGNTVVEYGEASLHTLGRSLMFMQRSMKEMQASIEKTHKAVCEVAQDFQEQAENTLYLERKIKIVERKMDHCAKQDPPMSKSRTAELAVLQSIRGRLKTSHRRAPYPCDYHPPRSTSCPHKNPAYSTEHLANLGRKLLKASHDGDGPAVRKLLQEGADPNFVSTSKWTPLHRAAWSAYPQVVSLLLDKGADVHARTAYGFTPLHIAAYNDPKGECVSLLVAAGSELDCKNISGWTPLHYAAECGNEAAARTLVAAGAAKAVRNDEDKTPLDVAKGEGVCWLLSFQ